MCLRLDGNRAVQCTHMPLCCLRLACNSHRWLTCFFFAFFALAFFFAAVLGVAPAGLLSSSASKAACSCSAAASSCFSLHSEPGLCYIPLICSSAMCFAGTVLCISTFLPDSKVAALLIAAQRTAPNHGLTQAWGGHQNCLAT